MLMLSSAFTSGFLLFAPYVYAQDHVVERHVSDFDSKGAGLTVTLLKFSHQQHLPIAIEYFDRASMNQPVKVSLRNTTIRAGTGFHSEQWQRVQVEAAKWNDRNHE
jgi:hypothetical protein